MESPRTIIEEAGIEVSPDDPRTLTEIARGIVERQQAEGEVVLAYELARTAVDESMRQTSISAATTGRRDRPYFVR